MKLYTTSALAEKFDCTTAAILTRARVRKVSHVKKDGREFMFDADAAKRLGPGKAGRPRGAKP